MYNQMARMEKTYTLNQINCFETTKNDTVLDIGCGPGRIAVPMAQRAKSVTALDQSERMLAYCRRNAQEAGVKNLKALPLDWNDTVLGKNFEQHDIVIAWANAPNIPMVIGDLFEGIGEAPKFPPMRIDRRLGYNINYNIIYDAGYDPNIRIVPDGFTMDYAAKAEAYQDLWQLRETGIAEPAPVFKKNVDKRLTKNKNGGIKFRRETKSFVMWWEPKAAV